MKKQIEITTERNFLETKNFENQVKRLMPAKVNHIHIDIPRMTVKGNRQYRYEVNIKINEKEIKLTKKTKDTLALINYQNTIYGTKQFNHWSKKVILNLLEYRIEKIVELIDEKEND